MAEKEVAETEAEKATVASVSARGTSAEHRVGQVVYESQQPGRRRFQSQLVCKCPGPRVLLSTAFLSFTVGFRRYAEYLEPVHDLAPLFKFRYAK